MRFTGIYGESREGLSGNPNAVGYNSFILAGISITGLLASKKISWKIIYFLTIAVGVFSLAASASRTGILALGIFIAVLSIMKGKTTVKYFSIALILILLLTSLGFFNFIKETIDFESIPVIGRFIEFDTGGRAQLWEEGMSIFNGIQFLTGIGLGSITSIQFWSFSASKMQNIYLELFIETGLIGIILFLSFIVSGAILIIRRWRESGLNEKNLWTGTAAFYFALCSYGLSESLLTPPNPLFHLLLLCIFLTYQPLKAKNI